MELVPFPGSHELARGRGPGLRTMTDSGEPVLLTCWRLDPGDLVEIARTGRVWLTIRGEKMPAAEISADQPPLPPLGNLLHDG